MDGEEVVISGSFSGDAIFLVGDDPKLRKDFLQRLNEARAQEAAHPVDLGKLKSLRGK